MDFVKQIRDLSSDEVICWLSLCFGGCSPGVFMLLHYRPELLMQMPVVLSLTFAITLSMPLLFWNAVLVGPFLPTFLEHVQDRYIERHYNDNGEHSIQETKLSHFLLGFSVGVTTCLSAAGAIGMARLLGLNFNGYLMLQLGIQLAVTVAAVVLLRRRQAEDSAIDYLAKKAVQKLHTKAVSANEVTTNPSP